MARQTLTVIDDETSIFGAKLVPKREAILERPKLLIQQGTNGSYEESDSSLRRQCREYVGWNILKDSR